MSKDKFIAKARLKHGKKYCYDKVIYNGSTTKVIITCDTHGDFIQSPVKHLSNGGCRLCGIEKRSINRIKDTNWFIQKANDVHNFKFDYSKTIYIKSKEDIIIICKNGHEFLQSPNSHLSGRGCSLCEKIGKPYWNTLPKLEFNEFILQSSIIHNNQYNYSKTFDTFKVGDANRKVLITCNKHGDFWQPVRTHIAGCIGCKRCHTKWRKEHELLDELRLYLKDIVILHQYSPKWLKRQIFDIYIPDYNIAVEYNGEQHYIPVGRYGGEKSLIGQIDSDNKKRKIAIDNKCELFEIPYFYTKGQRQIIFEKILSLIKEKHENKNNIT